MIGWFLQWREKKLSRNLGDVKVAEISFETFEGWMVNWMLGTKIIWMTCDVRIYAKQNYIHSSSNFQNSTFQNPDHEEFWSSILTWIFFCFDFVEFWILAGRKSNTPRSKFIQNFQKKPQFTKQIQKWQNFHSRNWLTRIFCRFLGSPDFWAFLGYDNVLYFEFENFWISCKFANILCKIHSRPNS